MITSRQNPLVKELVQLHRAKGRLQQGALLLEGTNLLDIALAQGYRLTTVCYTEAWAAQYPARSHQAQAQGDRVELVSEAVLGAMVTTVHPDGVVAVLPRHCLPWQAPAQPSLGVILAQVQDPGNVGTIIRTAAAVAADGVWCSGDSVAPDHPKVLRASAGMALGLPVIQTADLATLIQDYQNQGVQVVATAMDAPQTYWDWDWRSPSLILLGNEGAGLPPTLQNLAHGRVAIPQARGVESLNVAISAALLLYEAQRQRQVRPL